MKKVAAFFHNKDLLNRILFTFAIFLVFRIGSAITVPGVQTNQDIFADTTNALSILNRMGGGALQNFSLMALGVSPYITAQIIIQLLSMAVLPALTQRTKEGETGRKKIDPTASKATSEAAAANAVDTENTDRRRCACTSAITRAEKPFATWAQGTRRKDSTK